MEESAAVPLNGRLSAFSFFDAGVARAFPVGVLAVGLLSLGRRRGPALRVRQERICELLIIMATCGLHKGLSFFYVSLWSHVTLLRYFCVYFGSFASCFCFVSYLSYLSYYGVV